jgi:nuclear transport factor 2 (NTF2) superfamily protein
MKAILEFNLPEDKEEFDVASRGMDWALLAWDMDQFIRNKIKYEQNRDDVLQLVRDKLNCLMEEKGLKYPN